MKLKENARYREDLQMTIESIKGVESLRGKSVFVAGASGLIGSFLVDALLYANECKNMHVTIIAHGRSYEKLMARFGQENSFLRYMTGDVNEEILYEERLDYIIHLASNAYPEKFRTEPVETMIGNISGTLNLLKLAHKSPSCKMLYVSSGEVYGEIDKKKTEQDYGFVDVLSSRSCYPMSKRAGETLCCAYAEEYGVKVVIARPCHVYGPGSSEGDNRASTQFLKQAACKENIVLKSKGTQMRSYAYVADCVSGLLMVLLNGVDGQAYNIAPKDTVTIREFAELCAKKGGVQLFFADLKEIEKREQSPISSQVLVNRKLYEIGWQERFCIAEGIGRSVDILREIG